MKGRLNHISSFLLILFLFFSCQKKFLCPDCVDNKPPVANAGPDQTIILPKDSTFLDGSNSSDADGKIIAYKWSLLSGPFTGNIVSPANSRTLVKGLITGVYQFELMVTDDKGASGKDTLMITVSNGSGSNQPPVANAGPDQTITLPRDSVLLNGNLSMDPDGTIISYLWTKISGPVSGGFTSPGTVQNWARFLSPGIYVFQLAVTDNGGLTGKDTVQITVNAASGNQPPVANAGPDATVNFDFQDCVTPVTATLNGNASFDPDGSIVAWSWTRLNQEPALIASPSSAVTQVSNLLGARYIFRLEVTDNNGLTDDDTVVINVNGINRQETPAQLIPVGTLSKTRYGITMAAAGDKILFAGGSENSGSITIPSTRVDIYNTTTNTWSTAELSRARYEMSTVTAGNKIFFAGGLDGSPNSIASVDIYDVVTNTWSTAQLSQGRAGLAAASVGNKVMFAGGYYYMNAFGDLIFTNTVDIYDMVLNAWSTAALSMPRGLLTATTAGNKVYFAGGVTLSNPNDYTSTDQIDIYDGVSGAWTVSNLIEGKGNHAAISVNNKIYWAGGAVNTTSGTFSYVSRQVEIKDVNTNTSSIACLFQPNSNFQGVLKNNKIVFFRGSWGTQLNKFDIYDIGTNTWSIGVFSTSVGGSIVSAGNVIYVAGAYVNDVLSNQVWRLEF
jgi:hypothetical protein